jgi:hypothetical protein
MTEKSDCLYPTLRDYFGQETLGILIRKMLPNSLASLEKVASGKSNLGIVKDVVEEALKKPDRDSVAQAAE